MRGRHSRLWLTGVVIFAIGVLGLSPGAQATSRHTSPFLAGQPSRVGGYDNAAVADVMLGYVDQNGVNVCLGTPYGSAWPGECKQTVNCAIYRASGGTQQPGGGNDYFGSFIAAGGVEVAQASAVKGDVIQWGSGTTGSQHTAVVVENQGGGNFRVVDSNFNRDHIVRDHVMNVNTFFAGYTPRFARMGTPRGGGIADGSFVNYAGNVYIIVGGAPLYVGTWSIYGGVKPSTPLTSAQFAALRPYPADGTLINSQTGSVYRYAGGAPLYVAGWADIGGPQPTILVNEDDIVNSGAAAPFDHSRKVPVDGTFVNTQTGAVYRFAGGAPLYISSWDDVGGSQPSTRVSQFAIDQGGNTGSPLGHVGKYPIDGTFVNTPSGAVYRFAGGAPLYVGSWDDVGGPQPSTRVSQATIDQGGNMANPYGHVTKYPLDGTLVNVPSGHVFIFAGGAPLYVSNFAAIGGSRPTTQISSVTLEQGGAMALPWGHTLQYPADGTVLNSPAMTWSFKVAAGVATQIPRTAGSTVDAAALDNAGLAFPWNHLKSSVPKASLNVLPTIVTTATVWLSWSLLVTASKSTTYDVRWKAGSGVWQNPASFQGLVKGPLAGATPKRGVTYCFAIRAHNLAGITGPWSLSRCTKRA